MKKQSSMVKAYISVGVIFLILLCTTLIAAMITGKIMLLYLSAIMLVAIMSTINSIQIQLLQDRR